MALGNMATVSDTVTGITHCPNTLGFTGFDEGSPDGNDPLQVARMLARRGITLVSNKYQSIKSDLLNSVVCQFFVACEPALSGYSVSHHTFLA